MEKTPNLPAIYDPRQDKIKNRICFASVRTGVVWSSFHVKWLKPTEEHKAFPYSACRDVYFLELWPIMYVDSLPEWSCHMKFMKRAFVGFHRMYIKFPRMYDSVYHLTVLNGFYLFECWNSSSRKHEIVREGVMTLHTGNQV